MDCENATTQKLIDLLFDILFPSSLWFLLFENLQVEVTGKLEVHNSTTQ